MNAFDLESEVYDDTFTNTTIGKKQRSVVYRYLNKILDRHDRLEILELNCGTGVDALHMSKYGHKVTATDSSVGMVNVARRRFENHSADISVSCLDLNYGISDNHHYDLIFSNFGGLNCISIDNLSQLASNIFEHLTEQGSFIAVIMPRHSMVERIYRKAKGQSSVYSQRSTTSPLQVSVNDGFVDTYYYDPGDIKQVFGQFKFIRTIPIGYLPSYLESSKYRSIWNAISSVLSGIRVSPKYADHFLIHLMKS